MPTADAASIKPGASWPQWRGPTRNGVVESFAAPSRWPASLGSAWQIEVGEGHSSPVVVGERVYLLSRQGAEELVSCLELRTGKELWRTGHAVSYEMDPDAVEHGKGPKATVTVRDSRVFSFGITGVLSCLDASSGDVNWRKDFAGEFPKTAPRYGTAMSPLIEADMCIAHVGGQDRGALRAFDVRTGDVRWSWDGDGPGYASPLAADVAGERQIVTQSQRFVLGLSAKTGELLWQEPFETSHTMNIISPVFWQKTLIYSGYQEPLVAVAFERGGNSVKLAEVWRNRDLPLYMSDPVVKGNRLFGFTQKRSGQLFWLDLENNDVLWTSPARMGENAALLDGGSVLIALTNDGKLRFLDPADEAYRVIAEYTVAETPTWATPAISGNCILIKDRTRLSLFVVGEPRATGGRP